MITVLAYLHLNYYFPPAKNPHSASDATLEGHCATSLSFSCPWCFSYWSAMIRWKRYEGYGGSSLILTSSNDSPSAVLKGRWYREVACTDQRQIWELHTVSSTNQRHLLAVGGCFCNSDVPKLKWVQWRAGASSWNQSVCQSSVNSTYCPGRQC